MSIYLSPEVTLCVTALSETQSWSNPLDLQRRKLRHRERGGHATGVAIFPQASTWR